MTIADPHKLKFYPPTLSLASLYALNEWADALEESGGAGKLSAWIKAFVSMERTRRAREHNGGDPLDVQLPEIHLDQWTRREGAEAMAATFAMYAALPRDAQITRLVEAVMMTLLAFNVASS